MKSNGYEIKIDDLPETFRDVADLIGLDNALALVDMCGGMNLYVPKKDSCELAAKFRRIYEEYKASKSGTVYVDIAKKYNYSESYVRDIIRKFERKRIEENYQKPVQKDMFSNDF